MDFGAARADSRFPLGPTQFLSGIADLIVACGTVEHEPDPISAAMVVGEKSGFNSPTNESKHWQHGYGDEEISQFRGAELIAEKWNISREEMEQRFDEGVSA